MKAIIIITLLLTTGIANADYHYASHDGSDEPPYTSWETGAHLIQDAIDATNPHDTLYIGAGEWYEVAIMEFYDSIAVVGLGWDSTFWYTDAYHLPAIRLGDNCSVENILFRHPDWRSIEMSGGASASIRNCKFINSHWGASVKGGTSEVVNCVFDSCDKAVDIFDFSGNFLISNNLILNTTGNWALFIYSSSSIIQNNIIIPGGDINAIEGGNIIRNNVIIGGRNGITTSNSIRYNNVTKNLWQNGINATLNDTLFNNSISNCGKGVELYDSGSVIKFNNFYNNQVDIETWEFDFDSIGNVSCNPLYVSDEDVHLQAFSPLIDAGDPTYLDTDGSRSDIGAYGGIYGESYEYLDLPPAVPDSISGQYNQDTVYINWRFNTEADFRGYLLYKDTISGFEPSVFNQIAEPETSYYIDTDVDNEHNYYYRIASVDNQDNISDYSEELEIALTDIWNQSGAALPRITSIKTNYPNPFNTSTTIVYSVANLGPIPAEIKISIYDITGRKVRTLLDERRDIGEHNVIWDGRDDYGSECSSGVYFAKISQWSLELSGKPKKLVLIK
ncbi:MAG: T9SS type A sorting domain-containing protein [candidate division Zixibacteria bacterium]|nr:T9SS type A sorting domain-containing protein [candidate division Zixibacteria bacterium]